jgi:predicted exporter
MKHAAWNRRWTAIAVWLFGLALCAVVIGRTTFTADLSAFLPQSPTKEQRVLLDQLTDGVVSRLILVGIDGADAPTRARLSRAVARQLRGTRAFVSVSNGEPVNAERDQAFLFGNRYLLSPAVTPQRFTAEGMHEALGETIDLLASPAGLLVKPLLPRDPTGEFLQILDHINGGNQPRMQEGAWASRDGARALLLAQTAAAGADTDGQQDAMQRIRQAFDAAVKEQGKEQGKEQSRAAPATLVMTGPGVFSVQSRQAIESEVSRLSVISTVVIVAMLFFVYRSLTALVLGLVPVISGALAGVVAVGLGFGTVHGITLGFGITLIGEAVDYAIYLFVQSHQPGSVDDGRAGARMWSTIRLGVLTSIVGFSSLLLSSFPGLSQLGLYSIAGLVVAALVTRFVLPSLLPRGFRIRDVSAIGIRLHAVVRRASMLRWPIAILAVAAAAMLVQQRAHLWNTELASLSPVPPADQMADARLRADLGAPDVRYMVVISGASSDAALAGAEKVAAQLEPLVERGVLAAFESPSRYLPSADTQRARRDSLPDGDVAQRLRQATAGLPVRADRFEPFTADLAAARSRPLLQRADLDNTSLALAVDSLMFRRGDTWTALLPLTAPAGAAATGIAVEPVRKALAAAGQPDALFVDLKAESDNLYGGYLSEAITLSLAGLAAIVVLLTVVLHSPLRAARTLLPLFAAVVIVAALLMLLGQRLTILHLVGLLLIVAVGSNYVLFFNTRNDGPSAAPETISPQTLTSLAFANMTTVAAFGLLGFSQVPVLNAIGSTVGPGAILALVFAAAFADRRLLAPQPAESA